MANVTLTRVGDKKIHVIKIVRSYADIGLKEAKNLVDLVDPAMKWDSTHHRYMPSGLPSNPTVVATGLSDEEAKRMVADIEAAGGEAKVTSKSYVLYVGFFRHSGTGEILPYFADTRPGFNTESGEVQVRIEIDADRLNALFAPASISTFSGSISAVGE